MTRASDHLLDVGTDAVRDLLDMIGEDPNREGLKETPARFARALLEWTKGYDFDPESLLKTFADGADGYDQMVVLDSIPVQSLCEHHMAPFIGTATIGYIPDGKIVGLSKFGRVVDAYARRLQVQERLTRQIADVIEKVLRPKGVGVVIRCEHFCMGTRGVHMPGVFTTTSALRGNFRDDDGVVRSEFLSLAHQKG